MRFGPVLICCAFFSLLALLLGPGRAAAFDEKSAFEPDTFKRRYETHIRYGNKRRIASADLWQPIAQSPTSVFFAHLRSMTDNLENLEFNVGAGYRAYWTDHIWGGYGYIDRRITALGSTFYQATIGGEYIRDDYETRINIYIPQDKVSHYTVSGAQMPYAAGTGVYINAPDIITEEPQRGIDAEIGFRIPDLAGITYGTRIYGGGYHFRSGHATDTTGLRTRISTSLADWISIGARAQHDGERGGQYFLELVMTYPRVQKKEGAGMLRARMDDIPERDIDIVTGVAITPGGAAPVIDRSTGAPMRVLYVDNAAAGAGDGSAANPFHRLDDAVAASAPHDTIYVASGNGSASGYDTGTVITGSNLAIIGSGSPLTLSSARYRSDTATWDGDLIVRGAGDYPLFSNPGGNGITLAGQDITMRGIHFDASSGSGVKIETGADNIILENIRVTGNDLYGIEIDHGGTAPMHVTMRDTLVSGNYFHGILADQSAGGRIHLDLGEGASYGGNDIYGNIAGDIYADTGGQPITAQGNYWGGGAAGGITGPSAGLADASVYTADAFCATCMPALPDFTAVTGAALSSQVVSAPITLGGFTGHRYFQTYGAGSPQIVLNGTSVGSSARAKAGDALSISMTAAPTNLTTRSATLSGSGVNKNISVQTQ